MATTIGGVTIDFLANTAGIETSVAKAEKAVSAGAGRMARSLGAFDAGLRNTAGGVRDFAREALSLQNLAGGLAGGFAAAFSVEAVVAGFRTAIDAAGELVDTADRLGLGTGALQELRFAATQSGVEVAALDKVLEKLGVRLGEVRAGDEAATAAFDRLGLSQDVLAGRIGNSDQALAAIADRIAAIPDPMDRSAAAAAVFGDRIGPKLVGFLSQGSAGIDGLRNRARELGLVMDDSVIRAAEDAGDKLEALAGVLTTRAVIAFAAAAPAVGDFGEALNRNLPVIGTWIQRFTAFGEAVARYHPTLLALRTVMGAFGVGSAEAAGGIAEVEGQIAASQARIKQLQDATVANMAAGQKDAVKRLGEEVLAEEARIADLERRLAGLRSTPAPTTGGPARQAIVVPPPPARSLSAVPAEELKRLKERAATLLGQADAQYRYNAAAAEAKRLLDAGVVTQAEHNALIRQAAETRDRETGALGRTRKGAADAARDAKEAREDEKRDLEIIADMRRRLPAARVLAEPGTAGNAARSSNAAAAIQDLERRRNDAIEDAERRMSDTGRKDAARVAEVRRLAGANFDAAEAAEALADRQAHLNGVRAEGRAIVERLGGAERERDAEIARIVTLHGRGALTAEQYGAALRKVNEDYRKSAGGAGEYASAAENLQERLEGIAKLERSGALRPGEAGAARYEAGRDYNQARMGELSRSGNPYAGLELGFRSYVDQAGSGSEQVGDAIVSSVERGEDALVQLATTGKVEWRAMAADMLAEWSRMLIRMAIQRAIILGIEAAAGSGTGTGTTAGTGTGTTATTGSAGTGPTAGSLYALGGAFSSSVVHRPTAFAMPGGKRGVMGEAGDEAIMPLGRTSRGELGVRLAAGNSAAASLPAGGGSPLIGTLHVDARGATDPAMTRALVQRGAEAGAARGIDERRRNPRLRAGA